VGIALLGAEDVGFVDDDTPDGAVLLGFDAALVGDPGLETVGAGATDVGAGVEGALAEEGADTLPVALTLEGALLAPEAAV